MSLFRLLLAFHIITIISWMAGILYLLRLFVYHAQETEKVVRLRFEIMEHRLYKYITLPAMIAASAFGLAMIHMSPGLVGEHWMQAKLALVAGLIGVTLWSSKFIRLFRTDSVQRGHRFFRLLNEVPTLLMILIVLLVILRPALT